MTTSSQALGDWSVCKKCNCSTRYTWGECKPCYGDPKPCYRCNATGMNNWGRCFRCDGSGVISFEKAVKNACYDYNAMMRAAREMMG